MIITEIKHLNVRISEFEVPILDKKILPIFITPLILKEVEARKKSKYNIERLNLEKKLTFKKASFLEIVEELASRIIKINLDLEHYYYINPSDYVSLSEKFIDNFSTSRLAPHSHSPQSVDPSPALRARSECAAGSGVTTNPASSELPLHAKFFNKNNFFKGAGQKNTPNLLLSELVNAPYVSKGALVLIGDEGWDLELLANSNKKSRLHSIKNLRNYSIRNIRRLRRLRRLRLMTINLNFQKSHFPIQPIQPSGAIKVATISTPVLDVPASQERSTCSSSGSLLGSVWPKGAGSSHKLNKFTLLPEGSTAVPYWEDSETFKNIYSHNSEIFNNNYLLYLDITGNFDRNNSIMVGARSLNSIQDPYLTLDTPSDFLRSMDWEDRKKLLTKHNDNKLNFIINWIGDSLTTLKNTARPAQSSRSAGGSALDIDNITDLFLMQSSALAASPASQGSSPSALLRPAGASEGGVIFESKITREESSKTNLEPEGVKFFKLKNNLLIQKNKFLNEIKENKTKDQKTIKKIANESIVPLSYNHKRSYVPNAGGTLRPLRSSIFNSRNYSSLAYSLNIIFRAGLLTSNSLQSPQARSSATLPDLRGAALRSQSASNTEFNTNTVEKKKPIVLGEGLSARRTTSPKDLTSTPLSSVAAPKALREQQKQINKFTALLLHKTNLSQIKYQLRLNKFFLEVKYSNKDKDETYNKAVEIFEKIEYLHLKDILRNSSSVTATQAPRPPLAALAVQRREAREWAEKNEELLGGVVPLSSKGRSALRLRSTTRNFQNSNRLIIQPSLNNKKGQTNTNTLFNTNNLAKLFYRYNLALLKILISSQYTGKYPASNINRPLGPLSLSAGGERSPSTAALLINFKNSLVNMIPVSQKQNPEILGKGQIKISETSMTRTDTEEAQLAPSRAPRPQLNNKDNLSSSNTNSLRQATNFNVKKLEGRKPIKIKVKFNSPHADAERFDFTKFSDNKRFLFLYLILPILISTLTRYSTTLPTASPALHREARAAVGADRLPGVTTLRARSESSEEEIIFLNKQKKQLHSLIKLMFETRSTMRNLWLRKQMFILDLDSFARPSPAQSTRSAGVAKRGESSPGLDKFKYDKLGLRLVDNFSELLKLSLFFIAKNLAPQLNLLKESSSSDHLTDSLQRSSRKDAILHTSSPLDQRELRVLQDNREKGARTPLDQIAGTARTSLWGTEATVQTGKTKDRNSDYYNLIFLKIINSANKYQNEAGLVSDKVNAAQNFINNNNSLDLKEHTPLRQNASSTASSLQQITNIKDNNDYLEYTNKENQELPYITFYPGGRKAEDWKRITKIIWQEEFKFNAWYSRWARVNYSLNINWDNSTQRTIARYEGSGAPSGSYTPGFAGQAGSGGPALAKAALDNIEKIQKNFNDLIFAKSAIIGKLRSIKLVELIDILKEGIIKAEKIAALVRVSDITDLNLINKKKSRNIKSNKYLIKKNIYKSNKIKILQTIETIKTELRFEPKLDTNSLSNVPVSLLYYSNLSTVTSNSTSTSSGNIKEFNIDDDLPVVLSAYLKELSIYNRETKGIINSYSRILGYNFNPNNNKISSSIYNLLEASFKAMRCLISKPIFIIKPDKITIQLFYFLLVLNKKNLRIIRHKYKNSNTRKFFRNRFLKDSKILSQYSLNEVFPEELKALCASLNVIFNKPVELNLIRLHYPSKDTNILVNLIGIIINKFKLYRIKNNLFKGSIFKRLNNFYRTPLQSSTSVARNSKNKKINSSIIPAFITGLNIKIAGRIMTQPSRPRHTINLIRRGASARGKINYLNFARLTGKNKRGSYSISITAGYNFFK